MNTNFKIHVTDSLIKKLFAEINLANRYQKVISEKWLYPLYIYINDGKFSIRKTKRVGVEVNDLSITNANVGVVNAFFKALQLKEEILSIVDLDIDIVPKWIIDAIMTPKKPNSRSFFASSSVPAFLLPKLIENQNDPSVYNSLDFIDQLFLNKLDLIGSDKHGILYYPKFSSAHQFREKLSVPISYLSDESLKEVFGCSSEGFNGVTTGRFDMSDDGLFVINGCPYKARDIEQLADANCNLIASMIGRVSDTTTVNVRILCDNKLMATIGPLCGADGDLSFYIRDETERVNYIFKIEIKGYKIIIKATKDEKNNI